MLPRDERRVLDEMERRLHTDDPAFARKLSETGPRARFRAGRMLPRALSLAVAGLAVLCLFLGEAGAFFLSSALAGVLFLAATWTVHAE
ncbi:DUF3040 domain-containing protein [Saccharopolyspora rhizosphaerae]|uniref:DUF3040 domain-containing protein n=1 Tax=Saccharopolyspora rhizosphaerae TaxID=2492662 RepID=A0A426JUP3_9PSEU|nr:DUF3040 domain-containing protein [Saccharopolyspora rhizosphaerae]RRO16890.1 DUF3040 domain-containing protein [Saccharopolyspora rhizosphaerae]